MGRFEHVRTLHQSLDLARDCRAVPVGRASNTRAQFATALQYLPHGTIDVVIVRGRQVDLGPRRGGLAHSWWTRTAKEVPATFNARAETLAVKPMFRDAFRRNRCLIPASGYYEWLSTPTGKQPHYYTARDGAPLTFAG